MFTRNFFLIALLLANSPAAATTQTIGALGFGATGGACQPFSCSTAILTGSGLVSPLSWTPEYQQVYAAQNFVGGNHTFTGIAFPVELDPSGGGSLNGGTFQISLSTTSASVFGPGLTGTGLNTSNLSANLGSDNTVVYSGPLPAISGRMLTFTFTTPFTWNGNNGNLLLDVQSSNATNSVPFVYLATGTNAANFAQSLPAFSRAWAGAVNASWNTLGLVTTFFF